MKKETTWSITAALLYLSVFGLYTYPLVIKLTTHLPAYSGDVPIGVWNIWHFKKAILTATVFSWKSPFIFFPQNPSLAFHTYTLAAGIISLPFQIFFKPLTSYNLTCLVQFVLTGMGMYKLTYHLVNNRIAALWSGLALAFCPYVIISTTYSYNIPAIWFFPWFVFFLYKFLSTKKPGYSCAGALVYALCFLNDLNYFILISLLGLLIALFFFLKDRRNLFSKTILVWGLAGLVLFMLISSPYLIRLCSGCGNLTSSAWPASAIDYYSLHKWSLLRPSAFYAIYSHWPLVYPGYDITTAFLGYLSIVLAVVGITYIRPSVKNPELKHLAILCICGTLIFFALALGPSPLEKGCFLNKIAPYNILLKVNLLRQLRVPIRFAIVGIFSFYLLAALGIRRCLETDKIQFRVKKLLSVIIIGLQVIEFMPGKYPLYKMETEQIYEEISSQSAPHRPILILPLGWSNGYKTYGVDPRPIQYTQTVHERPIFQGHISRLQDSFFDFYLSEAGFKCLMDENIDLEDQATTEQVFNLIDRFDVKDIIIYQKYYTKRHLNSLLKLFGRHPERLRINVIE